MQSAIQQERPQIYYVLSRQWLIAAAYWLLVHYLHVYPLSYNHVICLYYFHVSMS